MYGFLVIAYLFLGGASAGALLVVSAWNLWFRRRHAAHAGRLRANRTCAPAPAAHAERLVFALEALSKRVYVVGFALLVLAMVCLLWDLGAPERALLVFTRPHATVLTFGAYTLAAETLIAALLAAAHTFGRPALSFRMRTVTEAICCVGAVCVMTYTGVFLAGSSGVPFWSSWWIVAVFTFSSLSCGLSLTLLVDWFTQGQTLLLRATRPLQKTHLACLAAETASIALFLAQTAANPAAHGALALLTAPDMLATAAVGVLGFGIVAPATLEAYSLARLDCRAIPVADALCLTGGLILRFCVIACGVH
ncbi:MAG: polysulfide reductase NrfD [Eggerthellaceae bacterium]|nr:polysulfide reductase NrfD [Eggerthellaceae bacterium]